LVEQDRKRKQDECNQAAAKAASAPKKTSGWTTFDDDDDDDGGGAPFLGGGYGMMGLVMAAPAAAPKPKAPVVVAQEPQSCTSGSNLAPLEQCSSLEFAHIVAFHVLIRVCLSISATRSVVGVCCSQCLID
jgi:hypothetical protein